MTQIVDPETYKVYIGNVDRDYRMEDFKAELESFGPMQNWYPKAGFVFVHYLSKKLQINIAQE